MGEGACKKVSRELVVDPMYGNILSCPSNCGTGLRASMMIKIPNASQQPNFKQWLTERKLQARGSGGFASEAKDDGIRDVSNVDRMGKDEVTLVNERSKVLRSSSSGRRHWKGSDGLPLPGAISSL